MARLLNANAAGTTLLALGDTTLPGLLLRYEMLALGVPLFIAIVPRTPAL